MRLRIYGIPRPVLFGVGLLPALLWLAFHPYSLLFPTEETHWVAGIGLLVAFCFVILFRRGIFVSRHFVYGTALLVLAVELVRSVGRRDFLSMGEGILGLAFLISAGLWLERRVAAASLNPKCQWFEGEPLVLNQVEASVKFGEESFPARLRRIDPEGMFLFLDPSLSWKGGQQVEVWLRCGGVEVEGQARIRARFSGEKTGLGLQFLSKDLYHFSRYTDLVQYLRGKGL